MTGNSEDRASDTPADDVRPARVEGNRPSAPRQRQLERLPARLDDIVGNPASQAGWHFCHVYDGWRIAIIDTRDRDDLTISHWSCGWSGNDALIVSLVGYGFREMPLSWKKRPSIL